MMRRRRSNGFTLVELIAATAIATALMGAVLQLIVTLARASKELEDVDNSVVWHDQVRAQLTNDLANSQTIELRRNGFVLHGNCGRATRLGNLSHRPSRVEYAIQQRGKFAVLNRTVILLPSGVQQDSRELVVGIDSVEVSWNDIEKLPLRYETPQVIPPALEIWLRNADESGVLRFEIQI